MAAKGSVLLGMAGDMIGDSDIRTHYMTKIGGSPWYPKTGPDPELEIPTCDLCGKDLALVLQVNYVVALRPIMMSTKYCAACPASFHRLALRIGRNFFSHGE